MLVKLTCHYCKYFGLPEDEPSGPKHVDVIRIKNKNINLENVHLVGLHFMIYIDMIMVGFTLFTGHKDP
jgi:hypothetical protein